MIKRMKPLLLALGAAALMAGCGSSNPNEFAGDYAGVGTNDNAYFAIEATVANNGSVTGLLYVYDGATPVPAGTNFPGSDYGEVIDFAGKVDGNDVSVTTTGDKYTITGSFGATGVFQGTIDEVGLDAPDYAFVAATPVAAGDDIAVACGEYSFSIVTSVEPAGAKFVPAYQGDTVFVTNGTDTFGIVVAWDGTLTGTFSGTVGDNICPLGGYCNDFTGTITGDWDGDATDFDVTGSAEVNTGTDYTDFLLTADMSNAAYSGGLDADTEHCYSWDI